MRKGVNVKRCKNYLHYMVHTNPSSYTRNLAKLIVLDNPS